MQSTYVDCITHRGITVPRFRHRTHYVYLLHFSRPFWHARHYLGSTSNLDGRLAAHHAGRSAKLLEAIHKEGIPFTLARLWPCSSAAEARSLEKRLKSWHGGGQFCPICKGLKVDVDVQLRVRGHGHLHIQTKPRKAMGGPRYF